MDCVGPEANARGSGRQGALTILKDLMNLFSTTSLLEQPKQWTELQAGIDCLTQLILLIDSMAASDETEMAEAAQTLQHQVIYNGEILDISIDSMRAYKDGTQSLAYLDSSIHLAYALLKMLEKWGKKGGSGEMYVRKKKKKARRKSCSPVSM